MYSLKMKVFNRKVFFLLVLAAGLYVLSTQSTVLKESVSHIQNANPWYVIIVIFMTVLTFICSALASVGSVSANKHKVSFTQELLIQVASSFTNRLLPSGIGGLALQGRYLYKAGLTPVEASVTVAVRTISAIVATSILLVISTFFVVNTSLIQNVHLPAKEAVYVAGFSMILGIVAARFLPGVTLRVKKYFAEAWLGFKEIKDPRKLLLLSIGCFGTPITYGLALYFSLKAFGVTVPPPAAYMSFELGTLTGTATPTPGGVGGFEAALTGALTVFGAEIDLALASVLLFRVITFWATTVIGFVAFQFVQRKKLI